MLALRENKFNSYRMNMCITNIYIHTYESSLYLKLCSIHIYTRTRHSYATRATNFGRFNWRQAATAAFAAAGNTFSVFCCCCCLYSARCWRVRKWHSFTLDGFDLGVDIRDIPWQSVYSEWNEQDYDVLWTIQLQICMHFNFIHYYYYLLMLLQFELFIRYAYWQSPRPITSRVL